MRPNKKVGEGSCKYCQAWIWWRESKDGVRYMAQPESKMPHAVECRVMAVQPQKGVPRLSAQEKAFSVDTNEAGPTPGGEGPATNQI